MIIQPPLLLMKGPISNESKISFWPGWLEGTSIFFGILVVVGLLTEGTRRYRGPFWPTAGRTPMTTTEVTAVQIVDRMAELLATPEKWTQGVYACNPDGDEVAVQSKSACQFCLAGALEKSRLDLLADQTVTYFVQATIFDLIATSMAQFNDASTTTHADILGLVAHVRVRLAA